MAIDAASFAGEWVSAWNSHDLDKIVSHYSFDIVFLSPLAQKRVGNGRIVGMNALRDYWGRAIEASPELRFELIEVLQGYDCLTIYYRNHRGQTVAETLEFGVNGKVIRSCACYA